MEKSEANKEYPEACYKQYKNRENRFVMSVTGMNENSKTASKRGKYELELHRGKLATLDGKPIGESDVLILLSELANYNNDEDLRMVMDYWIMLKECGHNGVHLKQKHQDTQNIDECCNGCADKRVKN